MDANDVVSCTNPNCLLLDSIDCDGTSVLLLPFIKSTNYLSGQQNKVCGVYIYSVGPIALAIKRNGKRYKGKKWIKLLKNHSDEENSWQSRFLDWRFLCECHAFYQNSYLLIWWPGNVCCPLLYSGNQDLNHRTANSENFCKTDCPSSVCIKLKWTWNQLQSCHPIYTMVKSAWGTSTTRWEHSNSEQLRASELRKEWALALGLHAHWQASWLLEIFEKENCWPVALSPLLIAWSLCSSHQITWLIEPQAKMWIQQPLKLCPAHFNEVLDCWHTDRRRLASKLHPWKHFHVILYSQHQQWGTLVQEHYGLQASNSPIHATIALILGPALPLGFGVYSMISLGAVSREIWAALNWEICGSLYRTRDNKTSFLLQLLLLGATFLVYFSVCSSCLLCLLSSHMQQCSKPSLVSGEFPSRIHEIQRLHTDKIWILPPWELLNGTLCC